jgi:hypothetical protein
MRTLVDHSLRSVQKWVEGRAYKGYDPGDGLTSYLRPLTCGNIFAERVLQQVVWKSPLNLRPLIGVVPLESTKGRGFMAGGYLHLYDAFRDHSYLQKLWHVWSGSTRHVKPGTQVTAGEITLTSRLGLGAWRPHAYCRLVGLIGQAFPEAYEQTHESGS